MSQLIDGGMDEFNVLAFPETNPAIIPYIEQQWNNFKESAHNRASAFYDRAKEVFEYSTSGEALRKARALKRKVQGIWDEDTIRLLDTVAKLQQAKPIMQRWIMACPEVRTAYHKQECDGYSDSYIDMHPGKVGEEHYDYRRAMDGVFVEDEEGNLVATSYLEDDDMMPLEDILEIDQQVDILNSWSNARIAMLVGGDDPTSPLNDSL